jgi:UDP-N-acetylmuramate--alanine ligase
MGFDSFIHQKKLFLVGIKGTGMASLVRALVGWGATVVGSDVAQRFSTDVLLEQLGIEVFESFDPQLLPQDCDILIHSAAYPKETHPQICLAAQKGIPIYSYPEWLALMSSRMHSYAVAGTHGKTTATGCAEWVLKHTGLSYCSLYGSHLQGEPVGPMNTIRTHKSTVALFEACEYHDHFLDYQLQGLLVTSIEHDHPDWFGTPEDVLYSFKRLVEKLPIKAPCICGTDSPLSRSLIDWIRQHRSDLLLITYGEDPSSMVRLSGYSDDGYESSFSLSPLDGFFHGRPGSVALCLDTVGSALLASCMVMTDSHIPVDHAMDVVTNPIFPALQREAESFPGTAGRLEELFTNNGIVYIDDYAHHPTEVAVALRSLQSRYGGRRILTIFYPHTVSRTKAYFDGFVEALSGSDLLIVRPVYASARCDGSPAESANLGRSLAESADGYFAQTEDAVIDIATELLLPGDVCVTMGAGNNNGLAKRIAERQRS